MRKDIRISIYQNDLRESLIDVNQELKVAYQLKELFLDITHHAYI